MQIKISHLALCLFVALIVFSGCEKYEFGPGFSLRTKKGRISNFWVIDEAYLNDTLDTGGVLPRFAIEINRDESFVYYDSLTNAQGGDSVAVYEGTWSFIDDAERVVLITELNSNGNQQVFLWQILRLAADEFWFEQKDGNLDIYEYHLVPKQ